MKITITSLDLRTGEITTRTETVEIYEGFKPAKVGA